MYLNFLKEDKNLEMEWKLDVPSFINKLAWMHQRPSWCHQTCEELQKALHSDPFIIIVLGLSTTYKIQNNHIWLDGCRLKKITQDHQDPFTKNDWLKNSLKHVEMSREWHEFDWRSHLKIPRCIPVAYSSEHNLGDIWTLHQ